MAFYVTKAGKRIEFPDDASPEEIQQIADAEEGVTRRSPQELQNAMMRNEPDAKEEWDARNNASQSNYLPDMYSPVKGERGTDLRVEGFGRSLNSTIEGAGQLMGITPQSQIDESARIDVPLMNNTHGQIGNIAGMTTQMLIPGTAAVRGGMLAPKIAALPVAGRAAIGLLGAGAENAAFSGIQPVVTGDTRGGNMAEGAAWGVGGKALQSGAGLLARGGSGVVSNTMKSLQEEAAKRGITLGVPELTNSPMIQTVSNQLGRLPFGGGAARAEKNKTAINRAVAKTIGEDADAVTSEVYDNAYTRLSGNYDKIKRDNPLPLTKELVDELSAIQKDAASKFSGAGKSVQGFLDDIANKSESGQLTGAQFKSLESELGKLTKSGGESALYLGRLRDTLRSHWQDSVQKSGNGADADLLNLTNSQYGSLKTIRDLVSKEGGDGISPQGLLSRVNKDNAGKERMARGNGGELGLLAQIGQKMKKPPDSGTADRLLVNGALATGLYGAQNHGYISPELALLIGGGLLGNRALNSRTASNYYAKGMPKPAAGLLRASAKPLPYLLPAIASTSAANEPKKKKKKKD